MDRELFENLCREYADRERVPGGIGTLAEKTIHAVLKDYMDSNPAHQEQPLAGYVADIWDGSAVVEIQTRQFGRLRDKLKAFLPEYPVTVVQPLAGTAYVTWIDPDTGEISSRRKKRSHGRIWDAVPELYRLKMFLKEPDLHFHFLFVDYDDIRVMNGIGKDRKKRAEKVDRIPSSLSGEFLLDRPSDYDIFLPEGLPEEFTSGDLKALAGCRKEEAGVALNLLTSLGRVERCGKKGNSILYRIPEDGESVQKME